MFKKVGFKSPRLHWYHYHPAMPSLEKENSKIFKRKQFVLSTKCQVGEECFYVQLLLLKQKKITMIETDELELLFDRLWPIHRSITGDGNRKTLEILSEIVPIELHEVPSGKKLNGGWVVPKEWKVNHAYLIGPPDQNS